MKFSRLTYRVNEDGGSVQPALVLSRPVSANTTVTVLSGDGSAEGSYYIYICMCICMCDVKLSTYLMNLF